MQMIFVKTHVNFQFCVISGIRVFTVTFEAQFVWPSKEAFRSPKNRLLHDLIMWSTFGKHENSSFFKKILLAQAERAY